MRGNAISNQIFSGTTRWQEEDEIGHDDLAHDISFTELLECERHCYERQDVAEPKPVVKAVPMAQVSWSTAQQLQGVSDAAFAIEAWRRGMKLVAAKNILSGKCHESGKKKHKRKKREGK
jgi:hypothetical protein